MKILFIFAVVALFLTPGCREKIVEADTEEASIHITSMPSNADIYLDKRDTGKITPDSLINLSEGIYLIELKKSGYMDTLFYVDLKIKQRSFHDIKMQSL